MAAVVSDVVRETFGWPNAALLPDDRLELLFWCREGHKSGDTILECLYEVERRSGVAFMHDCPELWQWTTGHLVDFLSARRGAPTAPYGDFDRKTSIAVGATRPTWTDHDEREPPAKGEAACHRELERGRVG